MAAKDDSLAALEVELFRTATACQQNYYELLSDLNCYEFDQFRYLRDHIGYAMFGPPEPNNNEIMNNAGNYVYEEKQQKAITAVYDKVLEHGLRHFPKKNIRSGVIYNVIFNKKQARLAFQKKNKELLTASEGTKYEDKKMASKYVNPEVQVHPVPVFKVKPLGCKEMYYIDTGARVYRGFEDYLTNNTLPKCTMVYPKDGKYQTDPSLYNKLELATEKIEDFVSAVWLESRESPASAVALKVLMGGDIASAIVGIASMGVGIAAMVSPVGPIIAGAGALGGVLSSVWGIGRSSAQLADRGNHDETIDPVKDRIALDAWIGIAGGAVGVATSGSTALLSRAIRTGATISKATSIAHDVMMVGNLIVYGVGISFKSYDVYLSYKKNKTIDPQDIIMLVGHLFFFCNSVMNVQFAKTVIKNSQIQILKDYESSLRSNRHRKEFQRMARNTRATGTNDVSTNGEIIRGINKISNRDEFFQAMVRSRKSLSASNARAAFSDGQVTVNSVLTIDPTEFSILPKDVRTRIIKTGVNPQTDISSGINMKNLAGVSNTFAGAKATNSASKSTVTPKNSSGHKPKVPTESTSNIAVRPKLKASSEAPSRNSAQPQADNSPTLILNEFVSRGSCAMLQVAPPRIEYFEGVLMELRSAPNCAMIFTNLLEIAYKILQHLQRHEKMSLGKCLGLIVEFLWDYVKLSARIAIRRLPIDDPAIRTIVVSIVVELAIRVEQHIDVWVETCQRRLEKKYPQTFSIPEFKTLSAFH